MSNDLRTAAQQALEALEEFCELQTMLRPGEKRDALRAALAEPAAPAEYEAAPNGRRSAVLTAMMNARPRAEAALEESFSAGAIAHAQAAWKLGYEARKAEEQPTVVEPVAWIYKPNRELLWPSEVEATNPLEIDEYLPLYLATPPRAPTVVEPVRRVQKQFMDEEVFYTTTPRAALTDAEIDAACGPCHDSDLARGFRAEFIKRFRAVYERLHILAASGGPRNE